jgi:hypothetical protein
MKKKESSVIVMKRKRKERELHDHTKFKENQRMEKVVKSNKSENNQGNV